jgi:hypothetical protein
LFVAIEHTWLAQADDNTLQQHAHCLQIGNSSVANEATQTLADNARDKPKHTDIATENNPERKLRKLKTPRTLTSPHAQLYPAVTRKQKTSMMLLPRTKEEMMHVMQKHTRQCRTTKSD